MDDLPLDDQTKGTFIKIVEKRQQPTYYGGPSRNKRESLDGLNDYQIGEKHLRYGDNFSNAFQKK